MANVGSPAVFTISAKSFAVPIVPVTVNPVKSKLRFTGPTERVLATFQFRISRDDPPANAGTLEVVSVSAVLSVPIIKKLWSTVIGLTAVKMIFPAPLSPVPLPLPVPALLDWLTANDELLSSANPNTPWL